MAKIIWDDSFSVGVAELDSQHQRLADLVNLLHDHAREPLDNKLMEKAISKLTVYAFTHFGHEEKLLAQCGYPDLESHMGEHEEFGQALMKFSREAAVGMLDRPKLFNFLSEWWAHHILEVDMQYKPFIAGEQRCGPLLD